MDKEKCIFCRQEAKYYEGSSLEVLCPVCGKYKISHRANEDFPNTKQILSDDNRWIYSGYLREVTERKLIINAITSENYVEILNSSLIPKTINEKIKKLLFYLYNKTNERFFGVDIEFSYTRDYSLLYAKNPQEACNIINEFNGYLYELIKSHESYGYIRLTAKGFEDIQLMQESNSSDQGFVAMWFDLSMDKMFLTIRDIVKNETGYRLLRIDLVEHNDDINDKIIAEIRRSKFLIADFTGDRGGVYYEAGFAHGLGKEVIFTCRNDYFNNERKPHFDIDHRSFIVWETPEQLAEKLVDRIRATIL